MYNALLGAIVITTANRIVRLKEGASPTVSATLTTGTFFLRGDGSASDFVKNLADALTLAGATYTAAIVFDANGVTRTATLTITGSTAFQLLLTTALGTTFDPALIGFPATTTASGTVLSTTLSPSTVWTSTEYNQELEPYSEKSVSLRRTANGKTSGVERSTRMFSYRLAYGFIPDTRMQMRRNKTDPAGTLEGFSDKQGAGARFELHDVDVTPGVSTLAALSSATLVGMVVFAEDTLSRFDAQRVAPGTPLYRWSGVVHEWVA